MNTFAVENIRVVYQRGLATLRLINVGLSRSTSEMFDYCLIKKRTRRMNLITLEQLLAKPVCMMTGEELSLLLQNIGTAKVSAEVTSEYKKRYVYGVQGIAETFGCSIPTANRIKASGVIDDAITQIGRKIVVDPELAIQLVKEAKAKGKDVTK